MKKTLAILALALTLVACGRSTDSRDERGFANRLFHALKQQDPSKFGTNIINADDVEYSMTFFSRNTSEYQAMTLEEKHDFEILFQKRIEEMLVAHSDQTRHMIAQLQTLLEDKSVPWSKIRFDGYEAAFADNEIDYMPRYGEYNILFHAGRKKYRLHTDGIVKIHDTWKLQLGDLSLETNN